MKEPRKKSFHLSMVILLLAWFGCQAVARFVAEISPGLSYNDSVTSGESLLLFIISAHVIHNFRTVTPIDNSKILNTLLGVLIFIIFVFSLIGTILYFF